MGHAVGMRKLGSLLLIETESQWRTMAARLPRLHAAGIQAEMVEAKHLAELEPLLDARRLLGACYHEHEGQVSPFALLSAFVYQARKRGLTLHPDAEVTGLVTRGGRITGVRTRQRDFSAGAVILCTGAWTPALGQMLGRIWRIPHVHGQALVTEAAPGLTLRNHIASAAFFEDAQNENKAAAAVLAISQTAEGHFLLGEAARLTDDLDALATPAGLTAIARLVARYFPTLQTLRLLRGWAASVAFTSDGLPFLGPVAGLTNLFMATAFKSTVIITPLVGRLMAQLVTTGRTDIDIAAFSPNR